MARISFQVQPIPGEKKFKDFQENFETIMETLLYLQNAFLFATIVEKARYRPKTSKGGERAIWAF